ncbi:MAG: hypothetical protein M3463_20350 [Verrucomicrobiota bacterium]|nr:hypothetical protein [Verrucomicrobiota bacterium]
MRKACAVFFAGLLGLWIEASLAQFQEWTGEPLAGVQIKTVAYKAWLPARKEPLRGTLVLIPGRLGDGRGMAADPKWQELGTGVGFAVLACQFSDGDPSLYQFDAQGEVAKAISTAVSHLAQLSAHPELDKAPLAFGGHSAGSNIAARYTNFAPARVAAMAGSKGSWGPGPETPPGKDEIPMLFVLGGKDKPEFTSGSMANIEPGLKRHAPWTVALQKNEGHESGPGMPLVRMFLKAAIEQRFQAPRGTGTALSIFKSAAPGFGGAKAAAPVKLQKIDPRQGWLGNPETYEIAPAVTYKGSRAKAIWLPDEATAKAWQDYLRS